MSQEKHKEYVYIEDDAINIRETIEKYSYHWKWFVLSGIIALFAAYFYLRYTPNQYQVSTTILIDDGRGGRLPSELSAFEDLGLMGDAKKPLQNEIGILKSRSLMQRVVEDLGINISYYTQGRVRESEVYKDKVPFKIHFFTKDSVFYNRDTVFFIEALSTTHFTLSNQDKTQSVKQVFGEKIETHFGAITVTPTDVNAIHTKDPVKVRIASLKAVANAYSNAITIDLLHKRSSIVDIRLQSKTRQKSKDILNALVKQYNKDAVEYKSLVGKNTEQFINERLVVIEKDLSDVDKGVERFKTTNRLTDIASEASVALETNTQLERKIVDLNTQLKLTDYVTDYVSSNSENLIPAKLGLSDAAVSSNSSRYNELLLERNRILESSSKKNPVIVNLDAQLGQLRSSINQSLVNLKSTLNIALKDAKSQESRMRSRIHAVPKQEREFRDIQRQQQIVETLYLYLLKKREENAITLAVTVPNAKIIDKADGSPTPVSPKRKLIFLISLILGLLVPFMILTILDLLDNKVHTKKDIEEATKVPFLGEIPKMNKKKSLITASDRGSTAEAFRMLRTNINFMIPNKEGESKVIYVTSTIPKEGKTSTAINLAAVMSFSDKKVLLIGADIRKPKISQYLNVSKGKGLTHFLIDTTIEVSEIITNLEHSKFDIIQSGIVPPNPSELLMNKRFEVVLAYAKDNYDYIIIDTAPVNMVSDTLLLSEKADLFLYVVRANFLDKRMLEIPEKLYREKRLPNMAIVLNESDLKKSYGYGYGYGYAYGEEKTKNSWWRKN